MVNFGEFLKTGILQSNSVTRYVTFKRTKINEKCQKLKITNKTFLVIYKQCVLVEILNNYLIICCFHHKLRILKQLIQARQFFESKTYSFHRLDLGRSQEQFWYGILSVWYRSVSHTCPPPRKSPLFYPTKIDQKWLELNIGQQWRHLPAFRQRGQKSGHLAAWNLVLTNTWKKG